MQLFCVKHEEGSPCLSAPQEFVELDLCYAQVILVPSSRSVRSDQRVRHGHGLVGDVSLVTNAMWFILVVVAVVVFLAVVVLTWTGNGVQLSVHKV